MLKDAQPETALPPEPCRVQAKTDDGQQPAVTRATRLGFRAAESAHHIDDKAYHQNQAKPAAADGRTSKVKPAATEQEKKNNYE